MRVFVSHASPDKRLIRPLVDALLAEGCEVFIDRPQDFGYRARDLRMHSIRHLPGGKQYDEELIDELRASDAVLGCLSKHLTKERDLLVGELQIAFATGRLVTVALDNLDFDKLPERLGFFRARVTQSYHVDSALLTEALRKRLNQNELSAAEKTEWARFEFIYHELQQRAATWRRDVTDPIFDPSGVSSRIDTASVADMLARTPRKRQVHSVERLLARAHSGGVFPLIVAGPENEAVAEFVGSIPEIWTSVRREGIRPHVLERIDLSFESDEYEVDYDLKRALARHLPFNDEVDFANDKLFADALSAVHPGIVLCTCRPLRVERVAAALNSVENWISFWARINAVAPYSKLRLVPVLPLLMAPAKPGWDVNRKGIIDDPCPPGAGWFGLPGLGSSINSRAHRALRALEKRSEASNALAPATYLPLLNPVRADEATSHVTAELPGLEKTKLQAIAELFPRRRSSGVPMASFIDNALGLFQNPVLGDRR